MELALGSRSLGTAHPLEDDIRVAAVTGFPWLVMDEGKVGRFLARPEFTIRDLRRLFLRTQPAALDGLLLPDSDPLYVPQVEALCKQARRLGTPVVVVQVEKPDARIGWWADVAQMWNTVLALAPVSAQKGLPLRQKGNREGLPLHREVVTDLSHPALGLYLDLVAWWQDGAVPRPSDAQITALLAVGDVDQNGRSVLPGEGIVPLAGLLAPLFVGGYDSLAVLMVNCEKVPSQPEGFVRGGYRALSELLSNVGWVVDDE